MALETDKHFETALQTDCLPRQIASFEGLTSINVPQSRFSMAFGLSCIIFAKDRQQRTTHPERQTTAPATTKTIPEGGISDKRSDYVLRETETDTHTPHHLRPQTAAKRTPGRQHATPSL